MVNVSWNLYNSDDPYITIAADQITIMRPYCEYDGQSAATDIVEDYFGHNREVWEDCFGDDRFAIMYIQIVAPDTIAGWYEVDVDHPPKATARMLTKDPRL